MTHRHAKRNDRQSIAVYAFLLAAFSCVMGLSFCLIKSPQARSQSYIAAAVTAMEQHQNQEAAAAALEAVRINPMAVQGWQILSRMLQQNGDVYAAKEAKSIASRVQQNPALAEPVYAMPAEFKLSLLALTDMPPGTQIP